MKKILNKRTEENAIDVETRFSGIPSIYQYCSKALELGHARNENPPLSNPETLYNNLSAIVASPLKFKANLDILPQCAQQCSLLIVKIMYHLKCTIKAENGD